MIFSAQAVGHNDRVTVRQCVIEVPQMQNGAQALDPTTGLEYSYNFLFFEGEDW